jgi:hypothetical protein
MTAAIRQKVVVQPGGRIEIPSSDLPAGANAEVIVILDAAQPGTTKLTDLVGCAKGNFATADEADAFLRGERDAWDR